MRTKTPRRGAPQEYVIQRVHCISYKHGRIGWSNDVTLQFIHVFPCVENSVRGNGKVEITLSRMGKRRRCKTQRPGEMAGLKI